MTPFLLVSGLLLGLAFAMTSQDAFAAESWGQPRQPTWSDAPVYSGRYPDATSTPEPWGTSDDRAVYGGWRDSSPGPSPWGEGGGSASPQPEYRFRGDPQPWSGHWGGQEETPQYRYRPLTGREAEQRAQTHAHDWRPLEPGRDDRGGRTRAPAGLMDALTPPPRTFGFEPMPWP